MSDLITPKLIARVEQSLRKRVKSDVRPHLLRYAAHANSEDEFMASAGRLLLNLRERQQWLAVWAARRHTEAGDSVPAEIDNTGPAPLDSLPAPNGAHGPESVHTVLLPFRLERGHDALS